MSARPLRSAARTFCPQEEKKDRFVETRTIRVPECSAAFTKTTWAVGGVGKGVTAGMDSVLGGSKRLAAVMAEWELTRSISQ